MIGKPTLEFVGRVLSAFEMGAKESAEDSGKTYDGLKGVQFVDRDGDKVLNTLLTTIGAIRIFQSGRPKSSILDGAHFAVLPKSGGELSVADHGGIVSSVGTGPELGENKPSILALKGLSSQMFLPYDPAFSGKYLKDFDGTNYIYAKGRDMYIIGVPSNGMSKARWISLSSTVPECIMQISETKYLTRRLFDIFQAVEDAIVYIFPANDNMIISFSSEKLKVSVAHVAGSPKAESLTLNFKIGESSFKLTKKQKELKLEKGESMDINQVSQLFGAQAPVGTTESAKEEVKPEVAAVAEAPKETSAAIPADVPIVKPVNLPTATTPTTPDTGATTTAPEVTTNATEVTTPAAPEPEVEVPLSDAISAIIEMLDERKQRDAVIHKACKDVHKRIKKLEKNPPKTDTDKIAELEAKVAKLTRMLTAAMG